LLLSALWPPHTSYQSIYAACARAQQKMRGRLNTTDDEISQQPSGDHADHCFIFLLQFSVIGFASYSSAEL